MEYKERFYRRWSKPLDLYCFEVKIKETDMFCCSDIDLREFIEERVLYYRYQLETYIRLNPAFYESLSPLPFDPFAPPIIKEMLSISGKIGVGPMATVAGAIAEYVGRDISALTEEFILENGGDIFLKTKKERLVNIFSGDSPFGRRVSIKIRPKESPVGICTSSGRVGPSLSFGNAHAVCVISSSSLFADGVATYLGNMVKSKRDLKAAMKKAEEFEKVDGVIIIIDDLMGCKGDVEIVEA